MYQERYELIVSEEIPSVVNNEVADEMVPDAGKDHIVDHFSGEAGFDVNTAVLLIWDYGGAGEQIIWTIKGSGTMPFKHLIPAAQVDGVKKLAVVAINDMVSGTAFMSGYAKLRKLP